MNGEILYYMRTPSQEFKVPEYWACAPEAYTHDDTISARDGLNSEVITTL